MDSGNKIKLKLNHYFNGYKKGDIIDVKCYGGIPTSQFWRNRLKDSEFDMCVTVIKENKKDKGKKVKKELIKNDESK